MNPTSNTDVSPDRRRWVPGTALRLCVIVVAGYLYGLGTTHLPAPDTGSVFWLGNLGAPYVLIPFLAGAWRFRAKVAPFAGAIGAAAAVAGFYHFLTVGNVVNMQLDLPVTVTARSVVIRAYANWFRTFLLGDPGGRPWLSVAIIVGLIFGYLGYRWWQKGDRLGVIIVAAVLIAEPLVYLSGLNDRILGTGYELHASNVVIWSIEALVGVALLVWGLRRPAPRR
jgi:hypothetical protein